jgi:endoglucanase
MKKMLKVLCFSVLTLGLSNVFADALSAKPLRVGPVQNYGALGTSGGKIISLASKKQVMLRGISLFWSDATGIQYYNPEVISYMTESLGIDVFRFAMGIQYYNSQGNASDPLDEAYSYMGAKESYLSKLDQMVQAAIENDVYIVVDWHSHRAESEKSAAKEFFSYVAQKYANVPNIIFEIYNEPVNTGWSTIQSYANDISGSIRTYTQNLILVGTPNWSQLTSYGNVNATNVAYVFHFYAASHSVGSFGNRITSAINSGNAVFISEWGTTSASGSGNPDASATQQWISFMEQNKISNCNWSMRQYTSTLNNSNEESAILNGSEYLTTKEALSKATFTSSGKLVTNYLNQYRSSWADSLIAGAKGACSFKNHTAKETDGAINGVLNAGCSYTSSDESVVTVNGSTLQIVGAGYAILQGNDGSKSIVTIIAEPSQTINKWDDFLCRLNGSCSGSRQMRDLTKTGGKEVVLSTTGKTNEGATITLTSLNPEVAEIKKAVCANSSYCYGDQLNANVTMLSFKNLGEAKIVATAPAVTGYRALNDTITVTLAKALNKLHSKFKDQTIALGATVNDCLPDTTMNARLPVTYTFNGEATSPYLTHVGNGIVAGMQNAVVQVTATAPETDYYEAFNKSITIVIGDSSQAVNKEEYQGSPIAAVLPGIPFRAEMQNSGVLLQVSEPGFVSLEIYSVAGKLKQSASRHYTAGSHYLSLESLPTGFYVMKVRQGSKQYMLKVNKQ